MAWCLDFHASYGCRHAGACCRGAWTIPFDDGTIAARGADGACSFLDGASHLCSIHAAQGQHALPLTCRMFPRIVLHDARGTFISLSHFCPTAAHLLFDAPGEARIVDAPRALSDVGELDGLDARGEWPPLLRAGVLMDFESYAAWERRAVSVLARAGASAADALASLDDVTSRIVRWTPGDGALQDAVHAAFDTASPAGSRDSGDVAAAAVKRWLAARLFGTWIAYQGDGLAATLRYLRSCLATFEGELAEDGSAREAIRRSDLAIVHRSAPLDLNLKR